MASNWKIVNNSPELITVIMDSHRESHEIKPQAKAVFRKANPLDRPTFHVFRDPQEDGFPDADTFLVAKTVELDILNRGALGSIIAASGMLSFSKKQDGSYALEQTDI